MFIQLLCLLLSIANASVGDYVVRSCAPTMANFVMDGLSERYGKRILLECPKNVKMTILLGPAELNNKRLDALVDLAIDEGHTLAYRLDPSYDRTFHEINPKRLQKRLLEAKSFFADRYRYKLMWVFFPPSNYHLAPLTRAASKARLVSFGNNIFVSSGFATTTISEVEQEVRLKSTTTKGPIIYFRGNYKKVLDDMEVVYKILRMNGLKPYTLDRCVP